MSIYDTLVSALEGGFYPVVKGLQEINNITTNKFMRHLDATKPPLERSPFVSIVGIDGTTTWGNLTPMTNTSHVHQTVNRWSAPVAQKKYVSGPESLGLLTENRILKALQAMYDTGSTDFVLVGHSRGGHIALKVAQFIEEENLKRRKIYNAYLQALDQSKRMAMRNPLTGNGSLMSTPPKKQPILPVPIPIRIRALGLFDAVDRDFTTGDTLKIPDIVENTYHAMRSPEVGSRGAFSNTGLVRGKGLYESQVFNGTHAAIGGEPWLGDHPVKSQKFVPENESYAYKTGANSRYEIKRDPVIFTGNGALNIKPISRDVLVTEYKISEAEDRNASAEAYNWMWSKLLRHAHFWDIFAVRNFDLVNSLRSPNYA